MAWLPQVAGVAHEDVVDDEVEVPLLLGNSDHGHPMVVDGCVKITLSVS